MISIDKFKELDIRIGTIISAEKIEGADKLLALQINIGQADPVQILAGIAQFYDPSALVGKQVPVIINLEPRTLKGKVSNGMMLAVIADDKPMLLHPENQVPPGSTVR